MRLIPRDPLPLELFATGGQSNMSGSGSLSELPGFEYAGRVHNFTNAWTWQNPAVEPIDSSAGQIDTVSLDADPGTSSNLAFADEMVRLRQRDIGLIPCAKGSSSITQWQPGSLSRSTLYGSMVARCLAAAARGVLKGILFYNGEEDSRTSVNANAYAANFLNFANGIRTDLGIPDLPIIVTEVGPLGSVEAPNRPYWATVQAQQRSLDGVNGIRCVSATGMSTKPDGLHLSTISHCAMGLRYARAMNEMLNAL
jgi:hypothetical protein